MKIPLDAATMRRREFLRAAGAGALGFSLSRPSLAGGERGGGPDARPVLVVIFLRGGIDALNAIVPLREPRYLEMRPTIAIPAEGEDGRAALALDANFGLHPALAPLLALWRAKQLAPIVAVGSPHPTRSHFDAQDFMEYAAPGMRTVKDGWLNRYLQATRSKKGADAPLRAVAMQGLLPRSLRGAYPVLAVPEGSGADSSQVLDFFEGLYLDEPGQEPAMGARADAVLASGRSTIETLRRYRAVQARAAAQGPAARYPRGSLGDKLRRIAALIKADEALEVACADWNGWDHHAGQGGLDGRHATMLAHLAGSLAAFFEDIGAAAARTLVLTMSEFGRTCRENGNAGTDHGHGGFMLALGGPVRGGEVLGRWSGLEERDLYQGRDLPVNTDFRDVLAEVLHEHMGFKLPREFFPGYRPGRGPGVIG